MNMMVLAYGVMGILIGASLFLLVVGVGLAVSGLLKYMAERKK